jgi:uncharacterized membrane protein YoaK (UPF0700 family)
MDPNNITQILREAKNSLEQAQEAYQARDVIRLLHSLIFCAAAITSAVALVALPAGKEVSPGVSN